MILQDLLILQDNVIKGSKDTFMEVDPHCMSQSCCKVCCGHRHCGSGDVMFLVCHVTLQDHVIERSCDFLVETLL